MCLFDLNDQPSCEFLRVFSQDISKPLILVMLNVTCILGFIQVHGKEQV